MRRPRNYAQNKLPGGDRGVRRGIRLDPIWPSHITDEVSSTCSSALEASGDDFEAALRINPNYENARVNRNRVRANEVMRQRQYP